MRGRVHKDFVYVAGQQCDHPTTLALPQPHPQP